MAAAPSDGWPDAVLAASLLAVDPHGLGGAVLRGLPGPARDRWLALVGDLLPAGSPVRRAPANVGDDRLLGGLDIAATLQSGRRISERGILADADGGLVVLPMAERASAGVAARIAAVVDQGAVTVERDGLALRVPTRFGLVAFDEGLHEDERCPIPLADRLAFRIDLARLATRGPGPLPTDQAGVQAARALFNSTRISQKLIEALCGAAAALGIESLRAAVLAVRAARAAAALDGRRDVTPADTGMAGRLVLAHRALCMPGSDEEEVEQVEPEEADREQAAGSQSVPEDPAHAGKDAQESVIEAVLASLPPGLLSELLQRGTVRTRSAHGDGAGGRQRSADRGRAIGTRAASGRRARLNVVETLRAAAPWQRLRREQAMAAGAQPGLPRVLVRSEDFRVTQYQRKRRSLTVFVVDASGSAALHRLAEAKGAVELLLAECYVRRDRVALLAFRGRTAEVLLPPTRSLARARRCLAALPAGGGTPLAAGLGAAATLSDAALRSGETPLVVVLTDGRANVAIDGTPGRAKAHEDALAAGRRFLASGVTGILVDTSPQSSPIAQSVATAMGARYLPLPQADARGISAAARTASRESMQDRPH